MPLHFEADLHLKTQKMIQMLETDFEKHGVKTLIEYCLELDGEDADSERESFYVS